MRYSDSQSVGVCFRELSSRLSEVDMRAWVHSFMSPLFRSSILFYLDCNMAGNLNLYDFNGSIRRNKVQEAIFSDLAKKENFMKKISEERVERQERSKRKVAALKIQSTYRGYRVRKQFQTSLRNLFDETGQTQSVVLLQTQISRLSFFFRPIIDCKRTLTLCSEAVILAQTAKANDLLDPRRRQQLLRCAVMLLEHIDRTNSYAPALRFFEIYIKEEDCLILLNCGFYSSMKTIYAPNAYKYLSTFELAISAEIDNRRICPTNAIFELFDTICKPKFEAVTVCCLAPFIAQLCKAGILKFADIMDALSSDRLSSRNAVSMLLISYTVVVITSAFPLEKLSDLEKVRLVTIFAELTQNITPSSEAVLAERSSSDSDTEDESNDTIMATTCDVEPDFLETVNYISLTNLFSSFRQLIPNLWKLIMSLNTSTVFGATQPLITILERGENISHSNEQSLIPALSIFITLMTNALKTVDDDDFQNGGVGDAVFPLTLCQVADVVRHCRDLTLGLIDLAFPVNSGLFQHSFVKSCRWSDLFQDVALLTKALHERDNRVCVMPHNFWSSHNRNVVVNSSIWQGRHGRRRRAKHPFEFVRFLLHSKDSDANDDPPSVSELRNLSIVRNIPFVIPFMQRIEIFAELLLRDRMQNSTGLSPKDLANSKIGFQAEMSILLLCTEQPCTKMLLELPDMKSTIRVQMVNWAGLEEAGIDGGATHEQLLYPNPLAPFLYPNNFFDHFYFIGRIIAKLIYEGLLADIRFADFFLLQWMGNPDGAVLDLELRCSLEEIETLDLDFTVMTDNFGVTEKIELKKDGSYIKVTADNRMEYIQLYVNYYLAKRLSPMIAALRSGLRNVIDPEWLRMFSPLEISMLVGGSDSEIDFNELRKFTALHNIKSEHDQQYMDSFWSVINGFSAGDKKKLLKFITGCPRPPIMGFKTLTPPMGIQLVHDIDKLPTAATCMNLLKLPLYEDTETLRRNLIYAINCGAGFELS
ncbi:Ubiquitin-protein ligase E3C [Dirofilaria immitis]|nr:Ubiquitin-protein ligase E3C [Dirofilaria immitis]